jgi:hypothetical protein
MCPCCSATDELVGKIYLPGTPSNLAFSGQQRHMQRDQKHGVDNHHEHEQPCIRIPAPVPEALHHFLKEVPAMRGLRAALGPNRQDSGHDCQIHASLDEEVVAGPESDNQRACSERSYCPRRAHRDVVQRNRVRNDMRRDEVEHECLPCWQVECIGNAGNQSKDEQMRDMKMAEVNVDGNQKSEDK